MWHKPNSNQGCLIYNHFSHYVKLNWIVKLNLLPVVSLKRSWQLFIYKLELFPIFYWPWQLFEQCWKYYLVIQKQTGFVTIDIPEQRKPPESNYKIILIYIFLRSSFYSLFYSSLSHESFKRIRNPFENNTNRYVKSK